MFYESRYDPDVPYKRGGLGAKATPGVPAPGMPVTTVTGRAGAVSPGPVYHGFGPFPLGAVTYHRYPGNGHTVASDPYTGTAWPATGATPGMPAPGFPAGIDPIGDPYTKSLTDPATGKVQWWVWGIVAVILLYVVKKYIV